LVLLELKALEEFKVLEDFPVFQVPMVLKVH
jgi:hypothetical protein